MFLDGEGRLKQYESIGQMINEYRMVRLNGYTRRKEYLLSALYREKSIIGQKIRLIEAYLGSQ